MSTVSSSASPRPASNTTATAPTAPHVSGAPATDTSPPAPRGPKSLPAALLKLARPKQWAKNVLVFAAPAAAGVLDNHEFALDAAIAFACFCLAAAGTYYINDASDAESDRLHPTKARRPVASGVVPVPVAYAGGVLLVAASIALALIVNGDLALTVGGYIVLTTTYSKVLKHVAVVDLVAVAAGFVLRAVGGAVATDQPISDWFFIVTSFGALFMISGKRAAEAKEMGDGAGDFRSVLAAYSTTYTAYLRSVTSGAVLVAYCLWAFEKADTVAASVTVPWYQLSILPFVMAVLRYALVLDQGRGSAPEEIILGDRPLQLIGVAWAVVFAIGVYTAA
jgi:decaprenyl-phosphate phosphoribosyltransferase